MRFAFIEQHREMYPVWLMSPEQIWECNVRSVLS